MSCICADAARGKTSARIARNFMSFANSACGPASSHRGAILVTMQPHFFKTPDDFRKWLAKNHSSAAELLVGFYKKDSGKRSITWPESVDEALCFGWIDGIRKGVDEDSYTIRFTPR